MITALIGGLIYADAHRKIGALPEGPRLAQIKQSPQWRATRFVNTIPRVEPELWPTISRWVQGAPNTTPTGPVDYAPRAASDFTEKTAEGLRITWLGHSTLLIEIDGRRILADPVWGERVSPFSMMGPARFHPPPLPMDALPKLDAVIISHDHYDHLDMPSIIALKDRGVPFIVPLGIGAHLEYWGVPSDRIVELDWWGQTKIAPGLTLTATPARHFSGRSIVMANQDATLWSGWAITGPKHRAYYSGDTAMFPGFKEIGERLGPFDVTMIESGAYNQLWADVHLGPEQAIEAHKMVRGNLMIPVHWGTFDLALHAWTEPPERIRAAALKAGVKIAIPKPGQSIGANAAPPVKQWWPALPWQTSSEAPVVSSGLD